MGEPVTKTPILRNYSPQRIEDVVLSIGLLKYDQFPPSKLPAPRVFLPIPGNWRIEPRTSLIGTLGPEEDTEVNFSIRLNKVGRYSLVFAARGRPEGGGNETVLWDTIWVELEPGSGHPPRITVIRLIAMAMLAGCGAVFVRKKSHTPY